MNKDSVYLAVFAVLCVLAGVLMGANITQRTNLAGHGQQGPNFREKAERFMSYGAKEHRDRKKNGPLEMLAVKLELNADQQVKVTEILEKARQEIDQVGKNIRSAIAEIREKGDKEIMAILNPQQQEKFKELQVEFKKRHESGRGKERPLPPGERLPPFQE
jgi:gas vesicle protein